MSGETILIEQLRADVERLRDDRADLQERRNRLSAEKAEALRLLERAERERDEWKAKHDTLADVSRACIATVERERDEAIRMERVTSDVLERVKHALRMPHDGGSYVDWAKTVRLAYDNVHANDAWREAIERERDEERYLADVRGDMLTKAERERDEARANYAFMVERAADQKLDGYRELGARAAAAEERAEKAERERDEARAERDARPNISAEDAAHAIQFFRGWDAPGSVTDKVFAALRAHAAKVKP